MMIGIGIDVETLEGIQGKCEIEVFRKKRRPVDPNKVSCPGNTIQMHHRKVRL